MSSGEGNEETNTTSTLYVWGIDKSIDQQTVKAEFAKHAKVKRVTVIKNKETGISKGFGYIECESPEEAAKALKEMDGSVIGELPIHIKYSVSEKPDWLKALESRGDGESYGVFADGGGFRGRGGPRGRGGFDFGRRGGFDFGGRGRPDFRGRGGPGFRGRGRSDFRGHGNRGYGQDFSRGGGRGNGHFYEDGDKGFPPMGDGYSGDPSVPPRDYYMNPSDRKPVNDYYEGQPQGDQYEQQSQPADPYNSRFSGDPYGAPSSNASGEKSLADPYSAPPARQTAGEAYTGGSQPPYNATDRRDVYREREDLYRPSDRGTGVAPGREEYQHGAAPAAQSQQGNYRSRSPVDKTRAAPAAESYGGVPAQQAGYDYYKSGGNSQPSYAGNSGYSNATNYGTAANPTQPHAAYEQPQGAAAARPMQTYEGNYGGAAEKSVSAYDSRAPPTGNNYGGYSDNYGQAPYQTAS